MATILILDPDPSRRQGHTQTIEAMGHTLIQAESGAQGIQLLSTYPDTTLVLSHLEIPDGTFEDFVRAVRSSAHYSIVPFVMMAEDCDATRLMQLIASGVEGTLKLPVDPEFLAATIRKGIEIYAQRHVTERRSA